MTPRRRRRDQRNEAARLTDQLLEEGFNKKQVGEILGRNPSLVSQFFTKNKGASMVEALRAVVQEVQAGGPRSIDSLKALADAHIQPRLNKAGSKARVRGKIGARAEKTVKDRRGKPVIGPDGAPVKAWSSSLARAGRQHIASGASRLRPVVEDAAKFGGKVAFTVRARKGAFKHDSGRNADSPACGAMWSSVGTAPKSGPTPTTAAAQDQAKRASTGASSRPWSTRPAVTSPPPCRSGWSTTTASSPVRRLLAWRSALGSPARTDRPAGPGRLLSAGALCCTPPPKRILLLCILGVCIMKACGTVPCAAPEGEAMAKPRPKKTDPNDELELVLVFDPATGLSTTTTAPRTTPIPDKPHSRRKKTR